MRSPITDKTTMYRLLSAGLLGNTIEQFFSVDAWGKSAAAARYDLWGVRTLKPGGPLRLNVPTADVSQVADSPEFRSAGVNISAMVSALYPTLWQGDVVRTTYGLEIVGHTRPPLGYNWRQIMLKPEPTLSGVAAVAKLKGVLNENGWDDVQDLLDLYPDHVLELSVFDRCLGVLPGRNYIMWEVRHY